MFIQRKIVWGLNKKLETYMKFSPRKQTNRHTNDIDRHDNVTNTILNTINGIHVNERKFYVKV